MAEEIYLDNHATTAVDPRVVEAMLPAMLSEYANAGSITHQPGRRAAQRIQEHKEQILYLLGAQHAELIFTSGATESINLALFGIALHPRQKRRSVLVGTIDHKAVLDCARKLSKQGLNVQTIDLVENQSADLLPCVGIYDLEALGKQLNDDVAIVSLILGNNEIGSLQDMRPIAELCHQHGAMLHLDATQAIGKIPFDAQAVGADLVSFSAHKFYGPKGVGGLLICNDTIQLSPVIVGGGQQNNLRSGTLNTAGIVGMARALEISVAQLDTELPMIYSLRDRLWQKLKTRIEGLKLNGPDWKTLPPSDPTVLQRLPGNLNVRFPNVDGQSLMLKVPSLAVSSGSACTSAEPAPSHVLIGIGLSQDQARSSLRFGIGRFNTESQIDQAADRIVAAYAELLHFVA
ncbi:MAG: cysteine desulfurase family protein [Planctomycetota bacterium]